AHDLVALTVIGAALAVADDDVGRAGILQHLGRNVAGMGAAGPGRAVLAADADAAALQRLGHGRNQRRRGAEAELGGGFAVLHPAGERLRLGETGPQPVHFPVADDQGASRRHAQASQELGKPARVLASSAPKGKAGGPPRLAAPAAPLYTAAPFQRLRRSLCFASRFWVFSCCSRCVPARPPGWPRA